MLLFDSRVARIRSDTNEINSRVGTLASLATYTAAMDAYDLRASAANLREAADKIDGIRSRLTQGEPA